MSSNNNKLKAIKDAINPDAFYYAKTTLVEIENTANRGGGSCWDFEEIKKQLNTPVIFDGRNQYIAYNLEEQGVEYYRIGK